LNELKSQESSIKKGKAEEKPGRKKSLLREYAEAILIALALALFIRTFIVQAFKIPSGSMIPTLNVGDHILVNKFSYGLNIFRESYFGLNFPPKDINIISYRKPQRGDIVVFKFPEDESRDFIKRVIGVEGDRVEIKDKIVYINGKSLNKEPYTIYRDPDIKPKDVSQRDNFDPIDVPVGHIFVMGDNRDGSHDSRFWGFVNIRKVKGNALIIYWSWDGDDHWVRWRRIGKLIY